MCPDCGGKVYWMYTCHTYGQGDEFWACWGCNSAIEYACLNCDWRYIHGLNPNNPRAVTNEKHRPDWLVEPPFINDRPNIPQGIKAGWEDNV